MNQVTKIIKEAAQTVGEEGRWRKGAYGNLSEKQLFFCGCAAGHLRHAAGAGANDYNGYLKLAFDRVALLIDPTLPPSPCEGVGEAVLIRWNDELERTQDEVVALLKEAAES